MKNLLIVSFLITTYLCVNTDILERAGQEYRQAEDNLYIGNLDEAHEGFMRAIELFGQVDTAYSQVSLCHYSMCISFFNQRDLTAMMKHMSEMETLYSRHSGDMSVAYDYLSVLAAYESGVYEEHPSDSLRCSIITHMRAALECQERMTHDEWRLRKIMPTFNYMNIAVMYDMMYQDAKRDSVRFYVDKAHEVNRTYKMPYHDYLEGEVSIRDMQAWLHYYDKDYKNAEREELEVLSMIDTLQDTRGNNILTERGEAYSFLAMLYEETGEYNKAMEYIRKSAENDRERFSADKNRAIREIEAKYELEKKETHINELRRKNISLLIILSVIVIAAIMAAGILLYRRRLREQRLYTEALNADAVMRAQQTSLTLLADSMGIKSVNLTEVQSIMEKAVTPLTIVDKKYIICFLSGESVKKIADRFNIEPASVYTVRYRLKKKFHKETILPF